MSYWFIVCSEKRNLAWSNTQGWVEGEDFDLFTDEEKAEMRLPLGGEWQEADNV